MFDCFSSVRIFFIRAFLGVSILFLPACAPATNVGAIGSTLPACPSPATNINPYLLHLQSPFIETIFTDYRINGSLNARQDAFMQLGENMKRWSDYRNIVNDENQMIRVVITYLDPVLIQYIILNNILSLPREKLNEIDITTRIHDEMTKLAKQDKLFFVVSISSPLYNEQVFNQTALNVRFPIEHLTLVNSFGMSTTPAQYDHILTEDVDIFQGPIYGIVGYPVSVIYQDTCIPFMRDTISSLTLDIGSLSMGEKTFNSLFWNIPYQSLMIQDDTHVVPLYDQSYDSRLSKIETPPIPDSRTNASLNENASRYYWEEMGRYFWHILIGESGH